MFGKKSSSHNQFSYNTPASNYPALIMRLLLAPMEGLLDFMLRDVLTRIGGIDHCVTEFIRITNTVLPKRSILRIAPELQNDSKTEAGVPVKVQILGSDPICMADNAAHIASLGAWAIDLNFGCPAKTVNRHRGGAVLLDEPELIFDIASAVRAAVPTTIPVSAKMRLGCNDTAKMLDCARAFADAGMQELVVHGRTKVQGYKPPAYWHHIAEIKHAINIPVIANGEIWSIEDYWQCRRESECDDIMLGRGMVQNPALALMIRQGEQEKLSWPQMQPWLQQFWLQVQQHVDARHQGGRLKQWFNYLRDEYPEACEDFAVIRTMTKADDISAYLFADRKAA